MDNLKVTDYGRNYFSTTADVGLLIISLEH